MPSKQRSKRPKTSGICNSVRTNGTSRICKRWTPNRTATKCCTAKATSVMCQNWSILVVWLECRFLDTEVDSSNPGNSMLCPWARHFIRIASVDSAVKWVPDGDNLVKDVQYNELFGGIALQNHAFFNWLLSTGKKKLQSNCIQQWNSKQLHGEYLTKWMRPLTVKEPSNCWKSAALK